jgi:signal transduction histidine kinase
MIFLTVVVASITAFISILIFPGFQSLLEQRLMGIKLPYQNLQEAYSSRITTSASLSDLLRLLDDELFPSLLIRQFAFIHLSNGSSKALLIKGITDDQLPGANNIDKLIDSAGRVRTPISPNDDPTLSWIRLILPLKIGEDLIGLWLLGRRDPDDLYPQAEIPILQALANQTAIALSNILQTERLRSLYQENINRYEQERLRLALDLHDSVLNQMAVLSMNLDPSSISPKFKEAYDELTQRLREIVSDLRPPMLQYGLKPALEGLSDNLMERSNDKVNVILDIQATEDRYPQNIELHLFRIAQEACENALHHGHAGKITISGQLDPQRIQLIIEDDGIGFEAGEILDLNSLLANKHFGLAGIVERANLIGAKLDIDSAPKAGTRISLSLDASQDKAKDKAPTAGL